jgi:three-Cys-motif partner protein
MLLERLVPEARHLGSSRSVRRYARWPRALRERRPGSPVLALQTLLRHSYREKLLNASEFNFLFIERDPANLAALEAELSQLKPFPARINVETSEGDAFERLSVILNELRRDRAQMAPAFLFVDPYGFKIPAGLLGDLMKAGRVELFINVMWRELDMLIQQRPAHGTPHAQTLDEIFGSGAWRAEVIGDGMDERLDRAIPLRPEVLAPGGGRLRCEWSRVDKRLGTSCST